MCGILGYYAFGDKRPQYDLLIEAWKKMKSRGDDGCGMAFPKDGTVYVSKTGDAVDTFLKTVEGKDDVAELINEAPARALFHTRKATWGTGTKAAQKTTDAATAHPFCYGDKVVVVHNGQIKNVTDLSKKYNFDADLKVDSQAIPITFFENKIWENTDNFSKSVEEISGAFTIAAMVVESDNIFLATNNERPLVFAYDETKKILYFCSELNIMSPLFISRVKTSKKIWNMLFDRDEVKYQAKPPYIYEVNAKMLFVIGPTGIEASKEFTPKPYFHYNTNYNYGFTHYNTTKASKEMSEKIRDGLSPIVFLLSKPFNLDLESRCDNFIKACNTTQMVVNEVNKHIPDEYDNIDPV